MPLLCVGLMEFKGGGVLLLFQRGGLKNDLERRGGVILLSPPPSLLYPFPPASQDNLICRRARDGFFLAYKKPIFERTSVL
jgi:hypothetical protein